MVLYNLQIIFCLSSYSIYLLLSLTALVNLQKNMKELIEIVRILLPRNKHWKYVGMFPFSILCVYMDIQSTHSELTFFFYISHCFLYLSLPFWLEGSHRKKKKSNDSKNLVDRVNYLTQMYFILNNNWCKPFIHLYPLPNFILVY